jgi:hypothetical protein
VQCAESRPQTKGSKQRFCSSRGSEVPYADWRHRRSSPLSQQLPPNPQIQRLQYLTQRALVQLDGQHPVSSIGIHPRGLSAMVKPHRSVAPSEEAPGAGGTTTASAMRATHTRAATMNKKYNNPLTTSVVQAIKAKIHTRPAFTTLPRSTSGRRSMKAATRGLLLKQGEGTVPAGAMTMTTGTASLPSPPTSSTNPIRRSSNQSESPSTMVSRTRASGFDATPLLLKFLRIQLHQSSLLPDGSEVRTPHMA